MPFHLNVKNFFSDQFNKYCINISCIDDLKMLKTKIKHFDVGDEIKDESIGIISPFSIKVTPFSTFNMLCFLSV